MRASSMFEQVSKNTRAQEVALRSAEAALSAANNENLRLKHDVLSSLRQIAVLQIEQDAPADAEVRRQLTLRGEEEQGLRTELGKLESSIEHQLKTLSQVNHDIGTTQQAIHESLLVDPEYVRVTNELTALHQGNVQENFEEVEAECKLKLQGFEQSIYRYLTNAAFGTEGYARTGLIRALDSWLAKGCNFFTNRQNELMLLALQRENFAAFLDWQAREKRLIGQIDAKRNETAQAPRLRDLARQRDKLDTDIQGAKKRANGMHDMLATYVDKTDGYYVKACDLLTAKLNMESIDGLLERVKSTPSPADDEALQTIVATKERIRVNEAKIDTLYDEKKAAQEDYDRAKKLERTLRTSNYTDDRYEYDSGLDLGSLITGYMAGRISQQSAINTVSNSRREVEVPPVFRSSGSSSSSNSDSDWGFSSTGSSGGDSFSTSDSF